MSSAGTFNVSGFIDARKVSWFHARVLAIAIIVAMVDGYDIGAPGFAAPDLIKAWHIANRASLGPMFSAALLGFLFGAPLFGYIGDRFGRKISILASCLTFGLLTLAAMAATSLNQLVVLRFLAGFGIGGVIPNVIAYVVEFAPRRYRATMVAIMLAGLAFGGSLPGAVAAWLLPHYGWRVIFFVGGVLPLVAALLVAFALPESVKFLVLKSRNPEAVIRTLRLMQRDVVPPASARFVIEDERQFTGLSPKYLFSDGLGRITPLLWICFVCNLAVYFFLVSWMPTLLIDAHLSTADAAFATSLMQIGGTIGGLSVSRMIDIKGIGSVCVLFALAIPVIAGIGYAGSAVTLLPLSFLAGICVLGLQSGLNISSGLIYPTSLRANGSGWAFAIGRIGSMAGPLVGSALITAHLPLQQIFLIVTLPFVVGTVASILLARALKSRFQDRKSGQFGASESAAVDVS